MTTLYNFNFEETESAKAAAQFLIQVHKQVDGYDDWTEEKLVKHLMRDSYLTVHAPMAWFPGFLSYTSVINKFVQENVVDNYEQSDNYNEDDSKSIERFLNTKPSGEEAYSSEKFSKVYSWNDLLSLVFHVCNKSNKTTSGKFWVLPIRSQSTIYVSTIGGQRMTRVTSKGVSWGTTFLLDFNRGLQFMSGDEPDEVENVNHQWYKLGDQDKSYDKLLELITAEFFSSSSQ